MKFKKGVSPPFLNQNTSEPTPAVAYWFKMTGIDKEKIQRYVKYQEENGRIEENNLSSSHHFWW